MQNYTVVYVVICYLIYSFLFSCQYQLLLEIKLTIAILLVITSRVHVYVVYKVIMFVSRSTVHACMV